MIEVSDPRKPLFNITKQFSRPELTPLGSKLPTSEPPVDEFPEKNRVRRLLMLGSMNLLQKYSSMNLQKVQSATQFIYGNHNRLNDLRIKKNQTSATLQKTPSKRVQDTV
jgi:hypothetical protein